MKGKLSKIFKSSFKRRQYHSSSNNDNLLGHYLAGLIEGLCVAPGSIIVLQASLALKQLEGPDNYVG
jgi:ABC-type nickel/cobalt efflux system permease component RcnA